MFAPLLVALTMAVAGQTVDQNFHTALADLKVNVPPEKHHVTRYIELTAYPQLIRQQFAATIIGALNSVSWRSLPAQPVVIADNEGHPQLLRIDLESLEWDYGARSIRLKELERRGVNFGFKDDRERNDQLNPWEFLVRQEPYHFVSHKVGKNFVRGWIDPVAADEAWRLSKSTNFILRADWLLPHMLTEKTFGGAYSLILQLPPNEADLYKVFEVPVKSADIAANKLRVGGAVNKSGGVAENNRELQMLPSSYGRPVAYVWRTLDVAKAAKGGKSVLDSTGGTLEHDGREMIGSLPNNWIWTYLCDAGTRRSDGKRVDVVPDAIASVKEPLIPSRDTRVINSYSCWKCHPKAIREFRDVVLPAIRNPTIALAVKSDKYRKDEAASVKGALEDYYNPDIGDIIKLQQTVYESAVFKTCGMTGQQYATAMVGFLEGYLKDTVGLDQAARETGFSVAELKVYLRYAVDLKRLDNEGKPLPDAVALVLSTGEEVPRGAWEETYGNVMRAKVWTGWEKEVIPVYVTIPASEPAPLYYMPNGH